MQSFHRSAQFLSLARKAASKTGYDPDKLELSDDGTHKLVYHSPKGIRRFGRIGYGDFIWYSQSDPELAKKKRNAFRRSHGVISEKYDLDKYSPNELAINILW